MVNFPNYYQDAGSDQMIGTISPSCSSDGLEISACEFNPSSRILTVRYETESGDDEASAQTIYVRSFKNPVTPAT